uniref:Condensin-2 complex subunit H2 n=1 Tax=Geotrypetes seraphini TaxID=260995 RepID=A0A6P8SB78_GEOSA|nr:condensin-2 complex subunit H2 [Geotrypetes seraphini]XP_033814038.1 condensin-2 complex subunit H2 [Geotrypetes seraphini]
MEDVESRYMHLLQPIRDLTKNWEVDVAAQLGEYLEELDQICISFDGGKTTMNFAEAALLIQGSACIYSRKVEYLYSLVYQALDFISNKKRDRQPPSIRVDGTDQDATLLNQQEEEEFLDLDDIQDPSKSNVDMRKEQTPNVVNIVPLTPMALVPPEEVEKKNNPLYSWKGEILASRKDFRMNTCTPHVSGAFMLEVAGMSPTQLFLRQNQREVNQNVTGLQNEGLNDDNGNLLMETSICQAPTPILNFSEDGAPTHNGDDGGEEDFLPCNEHHETDAEMDMVTKEHIEQQKALPEEKAYMLRERGPVPGSAAKVKEFLDPWRSLDPFESTEDKPFKKGKHFVLPRSISDDTGNKRKRRGPSKLQDFMEWFSMAHHDGEDTRKSRRKGPTFADMEILYWKHIKERTAAQKQLQKRMGAQFVKEVLELQQVEWENAEAQLPVIEEDRAEDYLDHDDPADNFSDHEDLALDVPPCLVEDPLLGDLEPGQIPDKLSYEDLVRKNVELFIANSQKYAQETVLSLRVRDWEDMMGPQLQEQEERGAFDIHEYGDRLVAGYGNVGEWHTFASLMAGKQAYEVCRYMLASLQLANDYTVEISQKPGLYESVDTMALRLLSRQRAHERFKTYAAPSISDK